MDTLSLQSNIGEGITAALANGVVTPFISYDSTDRNIFSSPLLPPSLIPESISEILRKIYVKHQGLHAYHNILLHFVVLKFFT